jgi:hypothetical protein
MGSSTLAPCAAVFGRAQRRARRLLGIRLAIIKYAFDFAVKLEVAIDNNSMVI